MFKNCCGCKNPSDKISGVVSEKDCEVYCKSSGNSGNVINDNVKELSSDLNIKNINVAENIPDTAMVQKKLDCHTEHPTKEVTSQQQASDASQMKEELQEQLPQPPKVPVPVTQAQNPGNENEEPLVKEPVRRKSILVNAVQKYPEPDDGWKPTSPEPDSCDMYAETLRAFAHGMLATPHPAKRSGSVPGLGSLPQWLSQEDDDDDVFREGGGTTEPPATPVGRDELALRRHRFFSDLLQVHQAATEHRVRFDPLGPIVAGGFEHEQRTPTVEFESLLNRLEKVTTRLEKTVVATEEALSKHSNTYNPQGIIKTLAVNEINETSVESKKIAKQSSLEDNREAKLPARKMSVTAFQDIVNGPLATFLKTSNQIGGDVAAISQLVNQAFQAQLQYLSLAAQSGAPSADQNMKLLEPTSNHIKAIQDYREKHRGSQQFNHLSAVSESIAALGWVTVSPAPAPYVKEMNDAGQFYTNRVLKEWKEKDKTHKTWVDTWVETLSELQKFVKQYHTTGLVWGGKIATSAGAVPPPPPGMPPPPPVMPIGDLPPLSDATQDRSALFAEINKGEAITSTLKKVTPDMQTHKNPTLRSGPAPFKAPAHTNTYRSVTAPTPVVDKSPTFIKEGKKWLVEYHKGNHALVVDNTEMNNVIYMYKCEDSSLTVKGKVNSVVLDSCRKSSVVFDSVVSSVEFVNCQSVQMQVLNKVPTISIDKTDGCQMYLSPESLDVEIVSAKSSEMNVMVPKSNGDYVEYPVPEQFKTTISSKGLLTLAVENKV